MSNDTAFWSVMPEVKKIDIGKSVPKTTLFIILWFKEMFFNLIMLKIILMLDKYHIF